jgi:hypothetical protein
MHEFHTWIHLAQSPYEDDRELLEVGVAVVADLIATADWPTAHFDLRSLNGAYVVTATGRANRIRDEGAFLDELLDLIGRELPGSYGLVYERADEIPDGFRVRVMARGEITERADPFLSPINPVIED